MLGFSKFYLYLAAGAVSLLLMGSAVIWLRYDAVQDHKTEAEAKQNEQRLKDIERTRERRNEVEDSTDDELLDKLLGRVRHGGGR